MDQTLHAMGNTVGSAFAYFAFVLQIIINMMSALCAFVERRFRQLSQLTILRYPVYNHQLTEMELERLSSVKRKTLVLDLDETLIHSQHDGMGRTLTAKPGVKADFTLNVVIDNHPVSFFVHKRPHVDFFLETVSKWFDLVVFTASMEVYGKAVCDKLEENKPIFKKRLYRQDCRQEYQSYTKDLQQVNQDISSVFILDNSPGAYRHYTENAIPIKSWFTDQYDTCLLNLLPVLDALRFTSDVRSILQRNRVVNNFCHH